MIRSTLLLLCIAACSPAAELSPAPAPAFCGAPCSSSDACRHDFGPCRVCSGGVCAESLPAEPTHPIDAGVDAPTATEVKGTIP